MTSIGLMTVATAVTSASYGLFELSMAFAFVVMIIVIAVGAISGAHVNPAITIALAVFGRFAWREVPAYIAAQLAGAISGSMLLYGLYRSPILRFEQANGIVRGSPESSITAMIFHCFAPNPAIAGANGWSTDLIGTPVAFAGEVFGTFVLALVLFLMLDPRNAFAPSPKSFAIIVGLVIGFIIMVLAPLTMSGINPARDLGPRITAWLLGWGDVAFPGIGPDWWVWTLGPIVGAVLGGGAAIALGRLISTSVPEDAAVAETVPAHEASSQPTDDAAGPASPHVPAASATTLTTR
ncbi:MAG: aquaporin [Actinomycetota bacterium]|nr:aquaporin [Actinomycetota bacterium]